LRAVVQAANQHGRLPPSPKAALLTSFILDSAGLSMFSAEPFHFGPQAVIDAFVYGEWSESILERRFTYWLESGQLMRSAAADCAAAANNQVSVVRKRIDKGTVKLDDHDSDGLSALRAAAQAGVRGCPTRSFQHITRTKSMAERRHLSCQHTCIVDLLLSSGAAIDDASETDGNTALHLCAQWGREITAEFLISKGANVSARNANLETPLHLVGTRTLMIKLPLSAANVSRSLSQASRYGHPGVLSTLFKGLPDPHVINYQLCTPVDVACRSDLLR
jgi:hypothetical protein